MSDLTRDQLLAFGSEPPKVVAVELPGKGTTYVLQMDARQRDAFLQAGWRDDPDTGERVRDFDNFTGKLLSCTLCSASGKPLFSLEDAEALGKWRGPLASLVAAEALTLNELFADAVEQAEKNSEPTTSDDSASS